MVFFRPVEGHKKEQLVRGTAADTDTDPAGHAYRYRYISHSLPLPQLPVSYSHVFTLYHLSHFLLSLAAAVGAVIFYGSSVSVAQVQAKGMPGIRIRCYYYCYYIILHQLDSAIHCCVYKAHKKYQRTREYLSLFAVAAAKGINFLIYPWNIFTWLQQQKYI